jgi:hypothetical protein
MLVSPQPLLPVTRRFSSNQIVPAPCLPENLLGQT